MFGLEVMAKKHREFFYNLVEEIGKPITIRKELPPQTAGITNVSRVLGVQVTQSTTAYPEVSIDAIVTGANSVAPLNSRDPGIVAPLALLQSSEIILRAKLSDVIVDPENPYGQTIFDIAHDVMIGETVFKVVGTDRSGLPPLPPYIVWCGLKSAGKK